MKNEPDDDLPSFERHRRRGGEHRRMSRSAGRNLRRRMCGSKKRFADSEDAKDFVFNRRHRQGFFLRVYECPFCKGFHTSSQRDHMDKDGEVKLD